MAEQPNGEIHDLLIIGAGPAALSAAVYTTREDIDTVLYEKGAIGGLAAVTDLIDNYPGYSEGVTGLDLSDDLRKHAERFGAEIRLGEVTSLMDEGAYKHLVTTDGDIYAKTVLIATGSDYKKLGIKGKTEYFARGVHFCATCDGAFYRDKRLVVVGGGNSALQETIFLTKFASHIDILVRGEKFRASDILQRELAEHDKVTVYLNTTTDEIVGEDNKVTKVIGTDKLTGRKVQFPTDGVFIFIGLDPNTQFLSDGSIDLNEIGMIKTDINLATNMPGVFSAGDVRDGATAQIASAVGEGAKAALMIREYLDAHRHDYPEESNIAEVAEVAVS
jgi:thioredoxin reductase (NADPH)